MTDEGRRALQEYGIAPPGRRTPARRRRSSLDSVGPLPAVRQRRHPRVEPVRLDRVQVAVGLPCVPRAVRPLQGDLTCPPTSRRPRVVVDTGRRHGTFHPLRVAAVEPLTDDAVAITFAVPDELRDDYAFDAGQHLTLRTEVDGTRCGATTRSARRPRPDRCGSASSGSTAASSPATRPRRCKVGDVVDVMTPDRALHARTRRRPRPGTTARSPPAAASRRCCRSSRRCSRSSRPAR